MMLNRMIQQLLHGCGYRIIWLQPPDLDRDFLDLYHQCKTYTMTTIERMYALYKATRYIAEHKILGDVVECGVWKGGSSMLCALTLKKTNDLQRKIYLYDTYEGMPEPSEIDVSYRGEKAMPAWKRLIRGDRNEWCFAPVEEVERNMLSTGYPHKNLLLVKGRVEETIPKVTPDRIAILRLDTDWHDSTYHELLHLFPRLSPNGVIILDDYGYWRGAKEAVDKYFQENDIRILLNRIDHTGRIGIKTDE
jgi:O-methyltransferase